jgi:RNA-directed DNA polymerase
MTHSDKSMNPHGGDASARVTIQPALDQNLMAQILDSENMQRAWKRVKSNQGAPGIDGTTLEDFPAFAREHWASIRQSLLDGCYQPAPVRRVMIPKRDGSGNVGWCGRGRRNTCLDPISWLTTATSV